MEITAAYNLAKLWWVWTAIGYIHASKKADTHNHKCAYSVYYRKRIRFCSIVNNINELIKSRNISESNEMSMLIVMAMMTTIITNSKNNKTWENKAEATTTRKTKLRQAKYAFICKWTIVQREAIASFLHFIAIKLQLYRWTDRCRWFCKQPVFGLKKAPSRTNWSFRFYVSFGWGTMATANRLIQ